MMIELVAVGNETEAYVERCLSSGFNIISSDDNNKGKTIVIQSLLYTLGNEPTFPTSFEYKKYYYYIRFKEKNVIYHLCRYNDGFVLKHQSTLMIFDNVGELKRYWTKHIFTLPSIIKNQVTRIVDPMLFVQIFFVGQDKKDTSNIAHSGFYNKNDFMEMLYSAFGLSGIQLRQEDIDRIKSSITALKDERTLLFKQHKILKSPKGPIRFLSTTSDRLAFGEKILQLEKVQSIIGELRKNRNSALARKAKWETTVRELRSLNRTINCGELRCMDCNSTNISFSAGRKSAYAFDVSTVDMRTEIISSIEEKIAAYSEEIEHLTMQIGTEQDKLKNLMSDESITLESIVAYKQDVFSASDAEKRIKEIDDEIASLNSRLLSSANASQANQKKRGALLSAIISKMNALYQKIDPDGNIEYKGLFTKRDELYSGSEATVFHLIKLLALQKVLGHDYPVIIDSFRAEDLSTIKENIILDVCRQIPNQIIFTTTLKLEEHGKYNNLQGINHIDYQGHISSKILTVKDVPEIIGLLSNLSIEL